MSKSSGYFSTANARWAGLGPYYAMFPRAFADEVVRKFSEPGDTVLDPFSGRGTALFSAQSAGRDALGIELNPVGWIYSKVKMAPSPLADVLARFREIEKTKHSFEDEAASLPTFFQWCFSREVQAFLLCARKKLDWRSDGIDRTVMSFILTHLHGGPTDAISNQMMQTKAMAPQYAVAWWKERKMKPPHLCPLDFFQRKLAWRYAKGTPKTRRSLVVLGDSTQALPQLNGALSKVGLKKPSLMLTSPPYLGITNYHYDQWIRLWMLGGPPSDRRGEAKLDGPHRGKFQNIPAYENLLLGVFEHSARLLRKDAIVYVRTDRREPTATITRSVLKLTFPRHKIQRINRPIEGKTQTRLFGHYAPRAGEVDFLLTP